MRLLAAIALVFCSPWVCRVAFAQAKLEANEQQAVEEVDTFEDAEEEPPAEPPITLVQRERGKALLGAAVGGDRWRSPSGHRLGYDVRIDGQLGYSVDSYERKPFSWGRSSLIALRFSLGGGSGSSHSELAGELSTGALFVMDRGGSGLVARVSGLGVAVLEPGSDAVLAGVGVPVGFAFHRSNFHGELLFWPSLGWAAVVLDDKNRGTGPLFAGTLARFGTDRLWFEGSSLRSLVQAEADSTRFSLCGRMGNWSVCTDGWWLHVRDIADDEPASFARVGLRLGVGSTATRDYESESPSSR